MIGIGLIVHLLGLQLITSASPLMTRRQSLTLHHVHYRSLGSEQPEDVELLCRKYHTGPDEARAAKGRL